MWSNVIAGLAGVAVEGLGENTGCVGWGLISLITLLPVIKLGLVGFISLQ